MRKLALPLIGLLLLLALAWSQSGGISVQPANIQQRVDTVHQVDPGNMYHRVYAVVPLTGTGQPGDPKRPMFAPLASEMKADHTGILGFQMQLSDDGTKALVEFVGRDRAALQAILAAPSTNPDVVVFEKGQTSQQEIEAAFQKYKQSFKLDNLTGVRPQ